MLGRSQFPTFAAKYAKRSTVLRAGDAEYRFSLPRAADATSYVRVKRGHGTGSQPMRRFSAETFPVRPVSSSGDSEVVQPDQGVWLHQARWGRTDVFVHISAVEKAGYTGLAAPAGFLLNGPGCSLIPGLRSRLSKYILAGFMVLSAVGACPPHNGVR